MFFVRMITALAILLLFASLFGIIVGLENGNIGQIVISGALFFFSAFALSGSKVEKEGNKIKK